jgi:hypothetical protein
MTTHATDNLQHYPLPPDLAAYLRTVDGLAQNTARAGQPVPETIILNDHDYVVVDQVVRAVSMHKHNAATVQWAGRHLSRHAVAVAA